MGKSNRRATRTSTNTTSSSPLARRTPSAAASSLAVLIVAILLAAPPINPAKAADTPAVVASGSLRAGGKAVAFVFSPPVGQACTSRLTPTQEDCPASNICAPQESEAVTAADVSDTLKLEITLPDDYPSGISELTVTCGSETVYLEEVSVEADSTLMLLETDKPVYKPGAVIRARSICLTSAYMKPCEGQESVRLVLVNPAGAKYTHKSNELNIPNLVQIRVVDGVQAGTTGVFDGSLEIDTKAPLGTYTVLAEGEDGLAAELEVQVDEYVLPKFEVSIAVDQKYLTPSSSVLSGKVSAVYSYGEKVAGEVNLKLLKEPGWGCYSYQDGPVGFSESSTSDCNPLVAEVKGGELQDGAYQFELSKLSDVSSWGSLQLEASVLEVATDTVLNASAAVPLQGDPWLEVDVTGPSVYFPGLYVDFDIISKMSDGESNDGTYLVEVEFRPHVPTGLKPMEGVPDDIPDVDVRSVEVEVLNGMAKARILSPPQPACCLETNLEVMNTACCWSTIEPRLYAIDSNGKQDSSTAAVGSCIEPAFPPRAHYVAVEALPEESNTPEGQISMSITATADISSMTPMYIVTSAGQYVQSGSLLASSLSYDAQTNLTSSSFLIPKLPEMIPEAHVVVGYIEPSSGSFISGEAFVALSSPADLGLLPSAPVSILTEPSTAPAEERNPLYYKPGEEIKVSVTAEPSSVVFLGAVDRSVSFLSDVDTRMTPARLMNALKAQAGVSSGEDLFLAEQSGCGAAAASLGAAGLMGPAPPQGTEPALCELYKQSGTWPTCWYPFFMDDVMEMAPVMNEAAFGYDYEDMGIFDKATGQAEESAPAAAGTSKVRNFFPETWIWRSAAVNAQGSFSFLEEVPDTITSWDVTGFSVSSSAGIGLGYGLPAGVTVFKPLFAQLKLPYKVVRGEELEVLATVFNYLPTEAQVQLVLLGEDGMVDVPPALQAHQLTLAANGAASVKVNLTFTGLGTAQLSLKATAAVSGGAEDNVVGTVKVVPEGRKANTDINVLLTPGETAVDYLVPVEVSDPGTLVPGSAYAKLTLAGEILGPSLDGLGSLVQMPTGCGEQNMLLMAPTVYVVHYLNAKGDTRPDLMAKAIQFIDIGFSRELDYMHDDGSFSAFGKSDDSGSTWLTAFVLKVFSQARNAGLLANANVLPEIVANAADWLTSEGVQDKQTGQFLPVGRVIHSEMMGGVVAGEDLPLTAFVTTALLEAHAAGLLPQGQASDGLALAVERVAAASAASNYATVLAAHCLVLATRHREGLDVPADLADTAQAAMEAMDAISMTSEDGAKHWAPEAVPAAASSKLVLPCAGCHVAHASGPEVEMTGYALSAQVINLGPQALADGFTVAKWLLSERSPGGGWRSTQDTVVALEGLTGYAALSTASPPEMNITVSYPASTSSSRRMLSSSRALRQVSGDVVTSVLTLGASNFDVLQYLDLPVGKNVTISVEGTGQAIASIGTVWHYYPEEEPEEATFQITSQAYQKTGSKFLTQDVKLQRVAEGQGMVICSVGVFSGLTPRVESLDALKNELSVCGGAVKRWEVENDEVSIYLDSLALGGAQCSMSMELEQDLIVNNMQPATVVAYEYYNPARKGVAEAQAAFPVVASVPDDGSAKIVLLKASIVLPNLAGPEDFTDSLQSTFRSDIAQAAGVTSPGDVLLGQIAAGSVVCDTAVIFRGASYADALKKSENFQSLLETSPEVVFNAAELGEAVANVVEIMGVTSEEELLNVLEEGGYADVTTAATDNSGTAGGLSGRGRSFSTAFSVLLLLVCARLM